MTRSKLTIDLKSDRSIPQKQSQWFLNRLEALSRIAQVCEVDALSLTKTLVGNDVVSERYTTEIANLIWHINTCIDLKANMPTSADLKRMSDWATNAMKLAKSDPDGAHSKTASAIKSKAIRISSFAKVVSSIPSETPRYPGAYWFAERVHGAFLVFDREIKSPTRAQGVSLSGYGYALEVAFKAFEVKGNHNRIASIHGPAREAIRRHIEV